MRVTSVLAALSLVVATASMQPAGAATASATITAVDVTGQAGIARVTNDGYGNSLVFDYNADGVDDLVLSRHMTAPTELFRGNADGTFTLAQQLPVADRHYCAAADFDSDGRPDFYCTIGAEKGTATDKSNELWLQTPLGDFVSVPGAWGAADPSGRGRDVAAADFNNDGRPDLFVGNGQPTTGPTPNRLFLNTGSAFTDATAELGTPRPGGICVQPADFNRDGWTDVFVCGRNNHLYVSRRGVSYEDRAKAYGMTQEWANDGQWGDLNGDGRLDLVLVGDTVLRVFLRSGAGFINPYTLPLTAGRNAAVTDLDQDGHLDIYVVQGRVDNRGSNVPDLLLIGAGNGLDFTDTGGFPQAGTGGGNDVSVLDHYQGRPTLLVTNGSDGIYTFTGPRQLLQFGS